MGRSGAAAVIRLAVIDQLPDVARTIGLDEQEWHHLRVRRVAPGAAVELLDGCGGVAVGRLSVEGRAEVHVEAIRRVPPPPALVLLVGAGDRDRMAALVEKAQELGVTRLVPVVTERAATVASRIRDSHLPKLVRRATEAMKQSGAAWRTAISAPLPLATAIAAVETPRRWVADPGGAAPTGVPRGEGITILIGPEGGLTDSELASARAAGFQPVRLGPHVLRFDTAAIVAAGWITANREEP